MATEKQGTAANDFVRTVLPWIVGAGGLILYLATLNPWISLDSLGMVARISGWAWRPELDQPLAFVLFWPLHFLPASALPFALNLVTALCAALVLALLARTVALLPYDVSPNDPSRKTRPLSFLATPSAWLPPVLTAILCGLQLSFWEHATSASGQMIDLLVFAYVVRNLLEFRIDRNPAWISRAVFAYAAGMANNWELVGCLLLFLAAVLRFNGLKASLDLRFLARTALWGVAGLSLYFLLPLALHLSSHGKIPFWVILRNHLKFQIAALAMLRSPGMRLLAVSTLLPLLLISVPWKSHTAQLGDDTALGVFITKATGHLVHGLFLAFAFWIALDPTFSPRHLYPGIPLLAYYYVCALVFGYCTGYFLLLESSAPRGALSKWPRAAGWLLLGALPAVLLWRNFAPIRTTNSPALHEFARQLYSDLPSGKSTALSESGGSLMLLRAELGAHGRDKESILLDTGYLASPRYQTLLAGEFKSRWPSLPLTNAQNSISPVQVREQVRRLAGSEPLVYLHPSAGFLLEPFEDEPLGLTHRLVLRPPGPDRPDQSPLLSVLMTNDLLWSRRWTNGLDDLALAIRRAGAPGPAWMQPALHLLRLTKETNLTSLVVGDAYSKELDDLGVRAQRLDKWEQAGVWFERALQLNPGNLSARINLLYNTRRRSGNFARLKVEPVEQQFESVFAKFGGWTEVLDAGGPVDEPTFLFQTAQALIPGENIHQVIRAFSRASELAPDWPAPRLGLAKCLLGQREFEKVLALTEQIQTENRQLKGPALANLLICRADALRGLGTTNAANACIQAFLAAHGEHDEVLNAAAFLFAESREFQQALDLLDQLLTRDPNRVDWLTQKGLAQMQLFRFDASAKTFTKTLLLDPKNEKARLCRALAYLNGNQLDQARADYSELLADSQLKQTSLFALGEIAWRERSTNGAIQFYQEYLSNSIHGSFQRGIASHRLKELAPEGAR